MLQRHGTAQFCSVHNVCPPTLAQICAETYPHTQSSFSVANVNAPHGGYTCTQLSVRLMVDADTQRTGSCFDDCECQ